MTILIETLPFSFELTLPYQLTGVERLLPVANVSSGHGYVSEAVIQFHRIAIDPKRVSGA